MELKEKREQTIVIMGEKLPKWQDCTWCKKELAVSFGSFGYDQPCNDCKNTEEYEKKQKENTGGGRSYDEILSVNKVNAVFEYKGRNVFINKKGDIIRDEKFKPLERGKKDWK